MKRVLFREYECCECTMIIQTTYTLQIFIWRSTRQYCQDATYDHLNLLARWQTILTFLTILQPHSLYNLTVWSTLNTQAFNDTTLDAHWSGVDMSFSILQYFNISQTLKRQQDHLPFFIQNNIQPCHWKDKLATSMHSSIERVATTHIRTFGTGNNPNSALGNKPRRTHGTARTTSQFNNMVHE